MSITRELVIVVKKNKNKPPNTSNETTLAFLNSKDWSSTHKTCTDSSQTRCSTKRESEHWVLPLT